LNWGFEDRGTLGAEYKVRTRFQPTTLAELIDLGRHSQKSSSIVLGYIEPGHAGAKAMRKLGI